MLKLNPNKTKEMLTGEPKFLDDIVLPTFNKAQMAPADFQGFIPDQALLLE